MKYGLFGPNFRNIFPGEDPRTPPTRAAAPMLNAFRRPCWPDSTVKAEIFGCVLFSVTSVPTIFTENKTHRKFRYNRYCIHVVLVHLPGKRVLLKISLHRTADFGEYRKYYTTSNFTFYFYSTCLLSKLVAAPVLTLGRVLTFGHKLTLGPDLCVVEIIFM